MVTLNFSFTDLPTLFYEKTDQRIEIVVGNPILIVSSESSTHRNLQSHRRTW